MHTLSSVRCFVGVGAFWMLGLAVGPPAVGDLVSFTEPGLRQPQCFRLMRLDTGAADVPSAWLSTTAGLPVGVRHVRLSDVSKGCK